MPIEPIWTKEIDEDFDSHEFASNLLEGAKENLRTDGFIQAAVFLVTSTELHCFSVSFEGYEQKEAAYAEAVRVGRELGACAIVTLNDAYLGKDKYDPEKYQWGDAAANPSGECVLVTVSGPGQENWQKQVTYQRGPDGITFGEVFEESNAFIGVLGEWSKKLKVI